MNKLTLKISIFILCAVLCFSGIVTVFAQTGDKKEEPKNDEVVKDTAVIENETGTITKDETVYVLADTDGSVQKIIVSDWLQNASSAASITDFSELSGLENVKGDETYTIKGDATVWDAQGNDIYYQGNIEKELPVGMTVSYTLDGKPVSADEIVGKSGKISIRFDYENRQYEMVNIGGKKEKIYVPFAMLTGMLLDSEQFRNITVSDGLLLNDGDRTAVIGIALPGLRENLGIGEETLRIPDHVEITADVTDFSFGITITIATNDLFNNLDISKLDSADGLPSAIGELADGLTQLLDGSSALYDGLCTLLDKSEELVSGINLLADGAKALKDGASSLCDGIGQVESGAAELSIGLNTLKSNNSALNDGAKQIFETLLSTAESQITAGGISMPSLTIDNYADVLDDVINSLDETSVYNMALEQVTAAVEANRSKIVDAVTIAVREQVAEKVIEIGAGMSKSNYDLLLSTGLVPKDKQDAVNAAINEQMETEYVQNIISENVEIQVKKAISDNMASDEVKAKLAEASDGAQSIISLKSSLDSYNTFYLGLSTYTEGVASAAEGASALASGASALKDGAAQLNAGVGTLYDGILQLQDGIPALVDGVTQLKDGAMQLNDGLKRFIDEGIGKIVNLEDGELNNITDRLKATIDVSKKYRSFSGIRDDMDGQVKFIYRTEEIE